jgi:hypothetical protein
MSDTVSTARTVSPDELLRIREGEWARRLCAVSLVTEFTVPERSADQAAQVLARKYRRAAHSLSEARRVLQRWPAVQVVSMVSAGINRYHAGNFWSPFRELLGLERDQDTQREWGEAFLENLRKLGLPTFDDVEDAGSKYVGRVLMHAGIPTYCLHDFLGLIVERRRRIPDLGPDEFVAWAAGRAEQQRLYNIDRPVVRFLRYGGEYAVDLADRTFELLDLVAEGVPRSVARTIP